jgi:hypothetical protein
MTTTDKRTVQAALAELEQLPFPTPAGVSVASFAGFDPDGRFLVEVGGGEPVVALSTIGLTEADVRTQVVVAYENGHAGRLIIIGRLQERATSPASGIKVDGERLVIRAEREIELRCGDASIVLTRAGKVLIRGNYVLTRSRGANKIKGAFVDIN